MCVLKTLSVILFDDGQATDPADFSYTDCPYSRIGQTHFAQHNATNSRVSTNTKRMHFQYLNIHLHTYVHVYIFAAWVDKRKTLTGILE